MRIGLKVKRSIKRKGKEREIFKLHVGFLSDEFSMQRPVEFGHLANYLKRNLNSS